MNVDDVKLKQSIAVLILKGQLIVFRHSRGLFNAVAVQLYSNRVDFGDLAVAVYNCKLMRSCGGCYVY